MVKYKAILEKYLPGGAVDTIYEWLQKYHVHLRISRKRTSKLGDYRPPQNGNGHNITVNHDLNRYAFLITLVHEIAHLVTWEKHGRRARAHGKEWKQEYRLLMEPFIDQGIFPPEVEKALKAYLQKSYASSGSDVHLTRALQQYDADPGITLEMLEEGSIFTLPNGRTFRKGKKMRKRYRCESLDNRRIYLVNPLARVTPGDHT